MIESWVEKPFFFFSNKLAMFQKTNHMKIHEKHPTILNKPSYALKVAKNQLKIKKSNQDPLMPLR
jgi:hypothetical protein